MNGINAQGSGESPLFQTTHWSVVLQAANGDSDAALERLCRHYWFPLYSFVRRQGHDIHDAQDLTQGFFELFLSKHYLRDVDRDKGRFRSFLLASIKHFLANEWKKSGRQKRGGGREIVSFDAMAAEERFQVEPLDAADSGEALFDRRWASAVLETVLARLKAEFALASKADRFAALSALIFEEPSPGTYPKLAAEWLVTESAVRSSVQRTRQRYAAIFREEIAGTVNDPRDVDDEVAYLLRAMGR